MPEIAIHSIGMTLLGGFALTLGALWLVIYISGVRDLHDSLPSRFDHQGANTSLHVRTGERFCR